MTGFWKFQIVILVVAIFVFGCSANERVLKSGREDTPRTNAAPTQTTFADELDEFRTADFQYILVLRRKDGGEIDAQDRSVIKLNTDGANRRVSADNGKAFIIGTNNAIPPKNIAAIYARFAVEDYSPEPTPEANR
ncbi:MAG: hypothetical protein ACKVQW_16810 [Pyrinomonadaceae bacterium]